MKTVIVMVVCSILIFFLVNNLIEHIEANLYNRAVQVQEILKDMP